MALLVFSFLFTILPSAIDRTIQLKETPGEVYQVLELKNGSFAVSFQGDLTDYSHAVGLFNEQGKLLRWMVPKSTGEVGAGKLKFLGGMAEHPDGKIWIADAEQFRLHQFSPNGSFYGSLLLQAPALAAHWLDFSTDGQFVYLGGCLPKGRGPYLGCTSLLHKRAILPPSGTQGFLNSDRQLGWKQSEKSLYRLAHESIATIRTEESHVVAYTNLSARKIWIVNTNKGTDIEVDLSQYIPEVPQLKTWQDAQQAYIGRPMLTKMFSLNNLVYVFLRNQESNRSALFEISSGGKIQQTWASKILPGVLVGKKGNTHLIFAYGNSLRFIGPRAMGKGK